MGGALLRMLEKGDQGQVYGEPISRSAAGIAVKCLWHEAQLKLPQDPGEVLERKNPKLISHARRVGAIGILNDLACRRATCLGYMPRSQRKLPGSAPLSRASWRTAKPVGSDPLLRGIGGG
jgi:hypothetical protein